MTTTAQAPRKIQTLRFFRITPLGSLMACCSLGSGDGHVFWLNRLFHCLPLPLEFHALLAQLQVPGIHHLWDDVGAIAELLSL